MLTQEFEARISALKAQVAALPPSARPALEALITETVERHSRISEAFDSMRTNLEDLRIAHSYMRFDLEATRRENAALKANRANPQHPENDDQPWCEGAD
ncbi:MAG: hypothetical protein ACOYN0_17305 [Phycisphaerales bacterium]